MGTGFGVGSQSDFPQLLNPVLGTRPKVRPLPRLKYSYLDWLDKSWVNDTLRAKAPS